MWRLVDWVLAPFERLVVRWREQRAPESLAFDDAHGTDTARFDLGNYEPTPPSVIGEVLDAVARVLGPAVSTAAFIDLGCGKGRVLMLAAERGFAAVIGIEVRAALVDVCRENLMRWAERDPRRRRPEVVWGDAESLPLPGGPRVLFLYNPFPRSVLAAVLARERGEVWLAYVNPVDETCAIEAGFHEIVRGASDPGWVLMHRVG